MFSIYVRPFGPFVWLRRRRIIEQVQVTQKSLPYRFTHWGIISTSFLPQDRQWLYWAEHWRGEGYGAAEGACDILQVGCYKLERVIGSKRVRVMCTDKGYMFEFV